jgi:Methyltransferase domain
MRFRAPHGSEAEPADRRASPGVVAARYRGDMNLRDQRMSGASCDAWYEGATFTTDWTTHHFATWKRILRSRRERVVDALEVGAWEGRSAIFWLNYFPGSRLTCVDTFGGSAEHHVAFADGLAAVERHFDANVTPYGARVEKIKARSTDALSLLGVQGRRFDFVYLDGSHRAADVYADACIAWSMVRPGGVLLFDDYTWVDMPDEMDRPKIGIDAFLLSAAGTFHEINRGLQVLIEKTAG